jgi:hypothetical protein
MSYFTIYFTLSGIMSITGQRMVGDYELSGKWKCQKKDPLHGIRYHFNVVARGSREMFQQSILAALLARVQF